MTTRYFGKVCVKHPEVNGERRKANRKCVACAREKMYAWAQKNRERMRAHARASYARNRHKRVEYRKQNAERLAEWHKNYYHANREAVKARNERWQRANKEKRLASLKNSNARRQRLIGGQKIAKRYTKEINAIYFGCPQGFHVDHIVPLRGKNVSGLHVPWNLQYLPAEVNKSKGNAWLG